MQYPFIPLLLLVACGAKARDANPPKGPYPGLYDAIESVRPRLLRCEDGMPGKLDCTLAHHGDTLGQSSYYSLGQSDEAIDKGVADSVDGDGRPWRSPRHKEARDGDFSRDHVLSLTLWSISRRNGDVLSRVLSYARSHDWNVCGESKCLLTPSLLDIMGDAIEYAGGGRPYGTNIPATVSEHQGRIEVETLSGQALSLVVDKCLIKAATGNLTSAWKDIAKKAADKNPGDLYFQFVSSYAGNGNFDAIVSAVVVELQAWQGPTPSGSFDRNGSGWQLMGLAGALQQTR